MLSRIKKLAATLSLCALSFAIYAEPLTQNVLKALTDQAQAGDLKAQAELADRYLQGDGVDKDITQAAVWYRKLAEAGVATAQMTLALLYIRGEGIEQNNEKAIHWLTQAAEQRNPTAQYLLGVAFAEGHGVKQDNITAYKWFEIAAAMDYTDAVEAAAALAKKMTKQEIATAEQQANDWWMKFHH